MKKWMKCFSVIMLMLIGLTGCGMKQLEVTESPYNEELDAVGVSVITYLSEKNYTGLVADVNQSKDMEKVADAEFYKELWESLEESYGKYGGFEYTGNVASSGYEIYSYEVFFTTHSINMNIVLSSDGILSGLNYQEKNVLSIDGKGSLGGEIVTIGDEFPLEGELVVPEGKEAMPLVILVHGSGASNRDESIGSIKPFYDIAEQLQELGIATYRYDKRTFKYGAEIDIDEFTIYEETIEDAVFAYDLFNEDPRFSGNVYILGHSLGGHVLPRIAELTPDAKGYIFMAANYSSILDLIDYQVKYIAEVDGDFTSQEKANVDATADLVKETKELDGTEEGIYLGAGSFYWKDLNDYDPGKAVSKINQPLLFLQGAGDYQVIPAELDLWLESADKEKTTSYVFDGLSHLFTPAGDPPSPEDYSGDYKVDTEVVKAMAEWINAE